MVSIGNGNLAILSKSYSFPQVWSNMGFIYSWFVIFFSGIYHHFHLQ
jgi:hypothetical protein